MPDNVPTSPLHAVNANPAVPFNTESELIFAQYSATEENMDSRDSQAKEITTENVSDNLGFEVGKMIHAAFPARMRKEEKLAACRVINFVLGEYLASELTPESIDNKEELNKVLITAIGMKYEGDQLGAFLRDTREVEQGNIWLPNNHPLRTYDRYGEYAVDWGAYPSWMQELAKPKPKPVTMPKNPYYVLGELTRDIVVGTYNGITSAFQWINTVTRVGCGADAAKSPAPAPTRADDLPLEEIIRNHEFITLSDPQYQTASTKIQKQINKDFDILKKNIIAEIRKAASEGPETELLMKQCLHTLPFVLFHPKWSKDLISRKQSIRNMDTAGYVDFDGTNIIVIKGHFDGKYFSHALVHECWHAREDKISKAPGWRPFDEEAITKCQKKLQALKHTIEACFIDPTLPECSEIEDIPAAYKHRTIYTKSCPKGKSSTVAFESKTKEQHYFQADIEHDPYSEDLCVIKNLQKNNQPLSEKKQQQAQAIMNLRSIPSFEQIQSDYAEYDTTVSKEKVKRMYKEEYYTNTFDKVPEVIRHKYCPGDFRQKVKDNRKAADKNRQEL